LPVATVALRAIFPAAAPTDAASRMADGGGGKKLTTLF